MTYTTALTGRPVVVAGGDAHAAAHVAALLTAGAQVTVVSPEVTATTQDLAERGLITWERRELRWSDVETAELILRPDAPPAPTPGTPHGTVTLVGGGPGDAGLLTVAGRTALETADVVLTDRLAPVEALTWVKPDATIIDVAKIPHGRSTPQSEINRLLTEHAGAGRHVVRLKGGDGFVFGRGGEEALACAEAGIACTVIPGVSSSIAAPALAGIPLTHRGLTQGFTVVSGHVPPGHAESTLDYPALARAGTTLVVLMGVRTLGSIAEALIDAGLDPTTAAAVVADGSLPSQRVVRAQASTIAAAADAAGIRPPAVAVIGAVADIAELT